MQGGLLLGVVHNCATKHRVASLLYACLAHNIKERAQYFGRNVLLRNIHKQRLCANVCLHRHCACALGVGGKHLSKGVLLARCRERKHLLPRGRGGDIHLFQAIGTRQVA